MLKKATCLESMPQTNIAQASTLKLIYAFRKDRYTLIFSLLLSGDF